MSALFDCAMSQPIHLGDSLAVMCFLVGALTGAMVCLGVCAAWSGR